MFDPTIGRWTTPDPKGFEAADADLFRYVRNNPTNATDSSGLEGRSAAVAWRDEEEARFWYNEADFTNTVSRRTGKIDVESGFFSWDLSVPRRDGGKVRMDITFQPKRDCPSRAISFIQVVRERKFDGEPGGVKDWEEKLVEDASLSSQLDILEGETDPYFSAMWDKKNEKWVDESGTLRVGNGVTGRAAFMRDRPGWKDDKRGHGEELFVKFETAAFAIDSQEVLGVLKWGYKIPADDDEPIELLGATRDDFSVFVSRTFQNIVETANESGLLRHTIRRPDRSTINVSGTSALRPPKPKKSSIMSPDLIPFPWRGAVDTIW